MANQVGVAFNKDGGRWYYAPDGTPYPSVTTVLKMEAKPFLVQWASTKCSDKSLECFGEFIDNKITAEKLLDGITKARFEHKNYSKQACDWGTDVHDAIELAKRLTKDWKVDEEGPCPICSDPESLEEVPAWLEVKGIVGKIIKLPQRDDVTENIEEQLIVEFYSR